MEDSEVYELYWVLNLSLYRGYLPNKHWQTSLVIYYHWVYLTKLSLKLFYYLVYNISFNKIKIPPLICQIKVGTFEKLRNYFTYHPKINNCEIIVKRPIVIKLMFPFHSHFEIPFFIIQLSPSYTPHVFLLFTSYLLLSLLVYSHSINNSASMEMENSYLGKTLLLLIYLYYLILR